MDKKKIAEFALAETIAKVSHIRSDLENCARSLPGHVDKKSVSYCNDILSRLDTFIELLNNQVPHDGSKAKPFVNRQLSDCIRSGELSRRSVSCLMRAGIATTNDLTYVTPQQLHQIRNCGKLTQFEITVFCELNSIVLGENSDKVPKFNVGDVVISLVDKKLIGYKEWFVKKGSEFIIVEARPYKGTGCFKLDDYKCRPLGSEDDCDFSIMTCGEIVKADKENDGKI